MSTDTKESNPKEAFGDKKADMALLPDTAAVQFNLAFLEGALKYGQYNWRVAGVKVSTYVKAARRHLSKFWNGQDIDPVTMVHELASVGACVAIMLDAIAVNKLTDDRPPRADMEKALEQAAFVAAHLKQLFKDHTPIQYTQAWVDSPANPAFIPPPPERFFIPCVDCSQPRVKGLIRCATHAESHGRVPAGTKEKTVRLWNCRNKDCFAPNVVGAHRYCIVCGHPRSKREAKRAAEVLPGCPRFSGQCTKKKGHRGECAVVVPGVPTILPAVSGAPTRGTKRKRLGRSLGALLKSENEG
jgi:hypothetical protein